jgi:hypothetical protein
LSEECKGCTAAAARDFLSNCDEQADIPSYVTLLSTAFAGDLSHSMAMARSAWVGAALGLTLGVWNLVSFWRNPDDDRVAGMLLLYGPMFISWTVVGFIAVRRTGRLRDALTAGTVFAFASFAMLWIANIVRVNLFLDVLREWPGWQQTVVARYRVSGFDSFRAFTNYEYVMDAPLKLAVPTVLGATLALVGGLIGRR